MHKNNAKYGTDGRQNISQPTVDVSNGYPGACLDGL